MIFNKVDGLEQYSRRVMVCNSHENFWCMIVQQIILKENNQLYVYHLVDFIFNKKYFI